MDIQSASSVVLQALTQATSQDTAVLKPVEEQLRQWETQPGFCSVLLVRIYLAVLYFKNGISRYWGRLLLQIATQIAVLTAKVARLDCPRQCPKLIPILLESVKVQDTPVFVLLFFFFFFKLASSIYSFACSLWNHHTDTFLQQIYAGDQHCFVVYLFVPLAVLRKLTVHGFIEPHNNMEVMGFLNAVFERLKQFIESCWQVGPGSICREKLEKTIILFTKVVSLKVQSRSRSAIGFIVQCMNLIKMIVKNDAYKPPESLEAHKIKTAFFTHQTLMEIGRRLVSKYFCWQRKTVEETGSDSWKYCLWPCTEVLFLDIFHNYSQTLTPESSRPSNVEDPVQMLMKDLCCLIFSVGLAAYKLFDNLIGQWILVKLRPLLYEVILSLMQDPDLVVSEAYRMSRFLKGRVQQKH
uniref:Importin 11 n=1 Tax=Cyprinus carpio TaxID=7962 RepID=A0A8C1WHS2_CYPCA